MNAIHSQLAEWFGDNADRRASETRLWSASPSRLLSYARRWLAERRRNAEVKQVAMLLTQTHRVVQVRQHKRIVVKRSKPETNLELLLNISCEAEVEKAVMAEVEAIRAEREAFFATLAVR